MAPSRKNFRELFRPLSKPAQARQKADPELNPALQAIWHIIACIPAGQVSTYGDVARAAGLPGHARQTAYALRMVPEELHLPWYRVLGAGGRIVFPKDSRQFREQARRLKGEGVTVKDGRVPKAAIIEADRLC